MELASHRFTWSSASLVVVAHSSDQSKSMHHELQYKTDDGTAAMKYVEFKRVVRSRVALKTVIIAVGMSTIAARPNCQAMNNAFLWNRANFQHTRIGQIRSLYRPDH